MNRALTPHCKRIIRQQIAMGRFNHESEVIRRSLRLAEALEDGAGPRGASFSGRQELEELLLEGRDSGSSTRMVAERQRRIYKRVVEEE